MQEINISPNLNDVERAVEGEKVKQKKAAKILLLFTVILLLLFTILTVLVMHRHTTGDKDLARAHLGLLHAGSYGNQSKQQLGNSIEAEGSHKVQRVRMTPVPFDHDDRVVPTESGMPGVTGSDSTVARQHLDTDYITQAPPINADVNGKKSRVRRETNRAKQARKQFEEYADCIAEKNMQYSTMYERPEIILATEKQPVTLSCRVW